MCIFGQTVHSVQLSAEKESIRKGAMLTSGRTRSSIDHSHRCRSGRSDREPGRRGGSGQPSRAIPSDGRRNAAESLFKSFSSGKPVVPVLPADPACSSAIPRLISGITNRLLLSIPLPQVVMNMPGNANWPSLLRSLRHFC